MKTTNERMATVRANKKQQGLTRKEVWLPANVIAKLQACYPIDKNGIDWLRIAQVAIDFPVATQAPGQD